MRIVSALIVLVAVAAAVGTSGAAASGGGTPTPTDAFITDTYAAVLRAVVDEQGNVDYAALKAHPEQLDEFTVSIEHVSPGTYQGWDRNAQIAFWLNAYNALTLELIIDHYPIQAVGAAPGYPADSIRQIPGAWDTIAFPVMGKDMTLNQVENEELRAKFGDPRIHMALVCAARSCPPLRREPYDGRTLDAQLDDQARRFLADPGHLQVDRAAKVVRLSPIFDWFAGDFVEQYGKTSGRFDPPLEAVIGFLGRFAPDADHAYLMQGDYRVEYLDYDWTLNERKK